MDKSTPHILLYRSVGLPELELIYDSDMKAFPTRLSQQPIFYPVLELAYARQIASEWNAKSGQSAGYVTEFKMQAAYLSRFEKHTVGGSEHQEFWIPAAELDEFNRHIIGHIKVLEGHFGDAFQGFIPDKFGLQGKNAVEQFTQLAHSYIYTQMDFYLEIRRNHKTIFLNYPFWQKYEFKNQPLKEKVLQMIKTSWLTSFPKISLPLPPPTNKDNPLIRQADAQTLVNEIHEDNHREEETNSSSSAYTDDTNVVPAEEIESYSWDDSEDEDSPPSKSTDTHSLANVAHEDALQVNETDMHTNSSGNAVDEDVAFIDETISNSRENPVQEDASPIEPTTSHFVQGLELVLNGKYHEGMDELSKAVAENPDDVVAHTSLGVVLHRLGEDERALSCYETSLRIDPTYPEAHYFRANILYSQGNVHEAIAGYTIAIGLKPELIEQHLKPMPQDRLTDFTPSLAEIYWIARPAQRILDLNKLLVTHPEQDHLLKERAAAYYRLRNFVQAIADYSLYLRRQPEDANAFHFRALAYEQIEQLDRALADYQQAVTINPQLSDVYINRGIAFGKMGNFRQSIASLTEGIRLAPRNPDSYFNRGMTYFQQGNFESAIQDFSIVIRLSPEDEAAYYWRGISYEEAGHQGESLADYRRFLEISQDSHTKYEIEQKLSQLDNAKRSSVVNANDIPDDRQKTSQVSLERSGEHLDLYDLIAALGERALNSTWFGRDVACLGENADELSAFTDQNTPIDGRDLLQITAGIQQTLEGDFQAFDPGAASPWIFIRAWNGSGFYMETNDPMMKERIQTHFQTVEEVEGASPFYEGLFLAFDQISK